MPEASSNDDARTRDAFVEAAFWYGSLDAAEEIRRAHPAIAAGDIHVATLLGDDAEVARLLARDPSLATARREPRGADPLTHLCFSRYLRLDPTRTEAFLRAARLLLDAGAPAHTGFFDSAHTPHRTWESALYGAAGVAFNPELTALLLAHGADPNDDEVPYHAAETYDNRTLRVLLDSARLNADSLAMLLLRKADWHDIAGARLLLDAGADPNRMTRWGTTSLHHAVLRDNNVEQIALLLDRGGDARLPRASDGRSAVALAARRGRADLLARFAGRGVDTALAGIDAVAAAATAADVDRGKALLASDPAARDALRDHGGELLVDFAGNDNAGGVRTLLALGVAVDAPYGARDPYWGLGPRTTALHVASWRGAHDVVALLVARGADVHARDDADRTPIMHAVRACVDSYWRERRRPDSVRTLLDAGATTQDVRVPTGYDAIDVLLASDAGAATRPPAPPPAAGST